MIYTLGFSASIGVDVCSHESLKIHLLSATPANRLEANPLTDLFTKLMDAFYRRQECGFHSVPEQFCR